MLSTLQSRLKKAGRLLPVALLPFAAHAQTLNYAAANAVNLAGTYTDLGANGTAIATANNDDANSTAQSIGFTFTYNGTAYTQFILNTNGLVKLGSAAPATAALYYENFAGGTGIDPLGAAGAAETNLLLPFNFDLVQGTGAAEYRVFSTGTTPNRVCTIQWKNVSDKSEAAGGALSQYANFSFQTKLYENGNIEFVYDAAVPSANAAATRFPNVGLKGSGTATNQVTLALKAVPADPWSATTFINQNYGLQAHNVNKTGVPDAGRTYRFVPGATTTPTAPANDNCTGAIALTAGTTCTPTTTTNAGATASTAPTPSCVTNGASNDVWYSIVVPTGGAVTVTTSAVTGSTLDDTVLELYSGACGSLTSLVCNDDATLGFSSATATGLTAGATIYARVWSYGTTATGQFGICAAVPAAAITNDNPAGAIVLPLAATCTPLNATNAGATTTPVSGYANPGCGIAASPKDVWFRFTTAASGQQGSTAVTITVTGAPAGQVRVFSAASAAGPFTSVGCSAGATNNTVAPALDLRGLTPATTYYVFVSGYGSADTQGAFTICASVLNLPATDAAVRVIYTLGTASASFTSPVTAQAVIANAGTTALTSLPVTLTVSGATTFTSTQTVATLAPGATTTVTFTYPVTATTGTNTLTVTVPADGLASNNSQVFTQAVSTNTLGYTSGTTFAGGFGSNSTTVTTATFYSKYTTSTAAAVTAVIPTFTGTATASNNYQVLIVAAATAGTPGTVLYTSPARVRPLAGGADVVAVPNVPVSGSFFVAVRQLTTTNLGLAFQDESPLRTGTFYASNDGIAFTDLSVAGTTFRPALSVTLGTVTATQNAALAATVGLYPNPAHQRFTLTVPTGLHTASAQLINALGQVVQTRQLNLPVAGGTADFNVSGLAAGVYSLQLKSGNDLVVKRVVVE